MTVKLSHKIRMYPNKSQENYLSRACGVARFTYNWALNEWITSYKAGEKPNKFSLKKDFNSIKKEKFPFVTEVTKCASERAFDNLGAAFTNFFRTLKSAKKKVGFPSFKKKGKHDSFYISNDQVSIIDNNKVKIPKLGLVKLAEQLRFKGKILSATVSRKGTHWYISFNMEIAKKDLPKTPASKNQTVGVDLGLHDLAVLSDGTTFTGPKPTRKLAGKIRRLSRSLARKKKGSHNRYKAKLKLANMHQRIANIRNDYLHKLTTYVANTFEKIAIEDLNVSGMVRNHKLAKAISDMGWFEFRRQLTYKTSYKERMLYVVDRFFPSTKTCSCCDNIKNDLKLSDRIFKCGK